MNKSMMVATMAGISVASVLSMTVEADASSSNQMKVYNTKSLKILSIQDQKKTVEVLSEGAVVSIIKSMEKQPGWYYVKTSSGKKGVCSGLYLKSITSQNQSSVSNNIYYTKENLNLRKGVGTGYPVIKNMPAKSKVEVISYHGDWAKVKHSGLTGYCNKNYLVKNVTTQTTQNTQSVLGAQATLHYATTNGLNIRTGTSTKYPIYKTVNAGTELNVISKLSNGWAKISMNGKIVYAHASYLSTKKPQVTQSTQVSQYTHSVTATVTTLKSNSKSVQNVATAFKKIDGKILKPGETFSYLGTIGGVTKANGFVESTIISGGKKSTGVGGGICLGSTTIHNAVMKSGLTVVERRNHSLPSSYVGKGMDAMVSTPLDYKFKNTSKYTVRIRAYVSNGQAVVKLESTGDTTGGYTFKPEAEVSANGLKATTRVWKMKNGKKIDVHQTFYSTYRSA